MSYDEWGRLEAEYCPYGKAVKYKYDASGNMIKKIDRKGYVTEYEYDAKDRRVSKVEPEGTEVRYRYDPTGNLVNFTQFSGSNSSSWNYQYDLLGRKIGETTPLGNEVSWDYDSVGNVVSYTNAEGDSTAYSYDFLNRLTNLSLPTGENISIDYKINEEECQGYEHPQTVSFSSKYAPDPPKIQKLEKRYDLMGRMERESWKVDKEWYNISYDHDEEGNVVRMEDQLGNVSTYTYDSMNLLSSVTDPDGDTTSYTYDGLGQLIETVYPTGTTISREYNKANLLTKVSNERSDGSVISSFSYGYDFNANRVSVTGSDGSSINYTYDKENRLTSVLYPDGSEYRYAYDGKDNIAEKTYLENNESLGSYQYTYDLENRLQQMGTKHYSYDQDGNMINSYYPQKRYEYLSTFINGQKVNQLREHSQGGFKTPVNYYSYPLDGRRVGKSGAYENGGLKQFKVYYLYDGQDVVYEFGENHTSVRYTHPRSGGCCGGGGCGVSSSVFTDHPISMTLDGQKYYYLFDGLGSVTEVINSNEEVVNRYRYSPFGQAMVKNESVFNPYQFTGRRYDEESGLYYYRARMYSAEMSRFTSSDPAQQGENWYAYVGNNPVNARDPSGLGTTLCPSCPPVINGGAGGTDLPIHEWCVQSCTEICIDKENFKGCIRNCIVACEGQPPIPLPYYKICTTVIGFICDKGIDKVCGWAASVICTKVGFVSDGVALPPCVTIAGEICSTIVDISDACGKGSKFICHEVLGYQPIDTKKENKPNSLSINRNIETTQYNSRLIW